MMRHSRHWSRHGNPIDSNIKQQPLETALQTPDVTMRMEILHTAHIVTIRVDRQPVKLVLSARMDPTENTVRRTYIPSLMLPRLPDTVTCKLLFGL
jgi:hypothetical protein